MRDAVGGVVAYATLLVLGEAIVLALVMGFLWALTG